MIEEGSEEAGVNSTFTTTVDDGLKDLSKGACFFFFLRERERGNLELVNCLGVFTTFVKCRHFMIFQPQLAAEKSHISSRWLELFSGSQEEIDFFSQDIRGHDLALLGHSLPLLLKFGVSS